MNNNLVLGTAQLGLSYGVANKTGQPNQSEATAVIREAWESGIHEFDTAQAYGESESVLGKSLFQLKIADKAKVITKFHPSLDHLDYAALENSISESLKKIRVPQIYGIMLHREEMLNLWHKGLSEILSKLVAKGLIKKVGISVYSPEKAIRALNMDGIDMVQIPTNILDRRFEDAGVYELAERTKKKIYIRSVFLQGLLLMRTEEIPKNLSFARSILRKMGSLSNDFNLTRQEIAIGYLKARMPNAHLIFGAETPLQIKENINAWQKDIPESLCRQIRITFQDVSASLLNPVLWPQ